MAKSVVADQILASFIEELKTKDKIPPSVLAILQDAVIRGDLGGAQTIKNVGSALAEN